MKNVTVRQLRVFAEVARHLSFSRAAAELHLTPPAVTMQVKELEANVGLPLIPAGCPGTRYSKPSGHFANARG